MKKLFDKKVSQDDYNLIKSTPGHKSNLSEDRPFKFILKGN